MDFGFIFGGQNQENSIKACVKKLALFCDFWGFWLDFGRPWALQKLKKIRKNRFLIAFSFEGGFWEGLGRVLGGFWEGFGKILGGFWEGFGKVLDGFWEDFGKKGRP